MRTFENVKDRLTIREAALLLGKQPRTLYKWIEDGTLPFSTNKNGIVQIHKDDLLLIESETFQRHAVSNLPNRPTART